MTGKIYSLCFSRRFAVVITLLALLNACVVSERSTTDQHSINLDTIDIKANLYKIYNPSKARKNDLLHTKLEVKFNWEKSWLHGKATLTLSPYFYPSDKLELDAKGFDIHEISLLVDTGKILLKTTYLPLEKNFSGIGVAFDMIKDTITITSVLPGSPSEALGIQEGDKIIKIGDELVAGTGIKNKNITDKLRGPSGTKVSISIVRKGVTTLINHTITRRKLLVQNFEKETLSIELDKEYTRRDTFNIYIEYTAKPDELDATGSSAIKDAKGLYFINPDGLEENKPRQIWTQGETESNSCWFPTKDSPNERMTQEIYITVDSNFTTLSNGLLIYSTDNGDGTRTDYWKQDLPHAPYLVMMAIGEYAVVKDKWREIEVNYYVEPKDEKYAMLNFGNTPEMLEFYSNKLGVDYPWEKYSQVVVRDFISGAMENTSATLHGEFVLRNDREYLDRNHEDIVAHEIFHHWFGDLVTCESWANLPLNESFATYGEYLWEEYKYGSDAADYHIQKDLKQYLRASKRTQVDLIRFGYNDKEDMFDSHSYAKGGRILHMLRKNVGDEAFFESLQYYLSTNKFAAVEIHDLRLAFEKVTGEDLNWFFNQWFLSSGHPQLVINYNYDDSLKQQIVSVWQVQKLENTPIYKLPVAIDIYVNGRVERHRVVIDSLEKTFTFNINTQPDLVNFDAEKMLLCMKKDKKTKDEWAFQYYNAPMYLDRYEAIKELGAGGDSLSAEVIIAALNDIFWNLRVLAMKNLKRVITSNKDKVKQKLIHLAQNDEKATVRSIAIKYLVKYFPDTPGEDDEMLKTLYGNAIKDKAYSVIGEGLQAMIKIDSSVAIDIVETLENPTKEALSLTIAEIYAKYGTEKQHDFFKETYKKINRYEKYSFFTLYGKYLLRQNDTTINKGLTMLEDVAKNDKTWWLRLTALDRIYTISAFYNTREKEVTEEIKKNKDDVAGNQELEEQLSNIKSQKKYVSDIIAKIEESESDSKVLKYFEISE